MHYAQDLYSRFRLHLSHRKFYDITTGLLGTHLYIVMLVNRAQNTLWLPETHMTHVIHNAKCSTHASWKNPPC